VALWPDFSIWLEFIVCEVKKQGILGSNLMIQNKKTALMLAKNDDC